MRFGKHGVALARNGALAAILILSGATANAFSVNAVSDEQPHGFNEPQARVHDLYLPEPTAIYDSKNGQRPGGDGVCAVEVRDQAPAVCFAEKQDAADYVSGHSRKPNTTSFIPTGFGGVQANSSSGTYVALTCWANTLGSSCSYNTVYWYVVGTSWNCTHAYPYNDIYRNYVPIYNTFYDAVASRNCNRMILYADSTQGGGSYVDCTIPPYSGEYDCYSSGGSQSWSLHNS